MSPRVICTKQYLSLNNQMQNNRIENPKIQPRKSEPSAKGLPPIKKSNTMRSDNTNKENSIVQQDKSYLKENAKIYNFFKNLTSGKLKSQENPNIPFQLFISNFRRRKILDAMMEKGPESLTDHQNKEVLKIYKKFLKKTHQSNQNKENTE